MARLQRHDLLGRIAQLAGARADDPTIERTLLATLGELAAELPDVDRRALLDVTPSECVPPELHEPSSGSPIDRVARRAALPLGRAREETAAVVRALAEALSAEARARLFRHVDPELRALVSAMDHAPESTAAHAPPAPVRRAPPTLATGRPGSEHPLSEARPDVAHAHSIARSDEPHADTKLSSAHGITQERLHETLSEGAPPQPSRTIARG
jgi:hypothetical protein